MEAFLVFFFGAAMGSFLALVIERLPIGESIVVGRSHCTGCGKLLRCWEMVPILSQIALGSKCKRCGVQIPIWYAFFEAAIGVCALWTLSNLTEGILLAMSLTLSIFDQREHAFPFSVWAIFTLILFCIVPFSLSDLTILAFALLASLKNLRIGAGDILWLYSASLVVTQLEIVLILQFAAIGGIIHYLLQKEKGEIAFIPHLTGALGLLLLTRPVWAQILTP
ncbi:MAG: prepilin peptidase [Streptococcaceae bacterium]|jgi:leader peptidase (prepilin peptidase)/N-methyltransferase|nr:prepilin peptidase [Streptococcaceae bacterium]